MENNNLPQKADGRQKQLTSAMSFKKDLCDSIALLNDVTPLPKEVCVRWANRIIELSPDTTLDDVRKAVDGITANTYEWRYDQGIRNVFAAIEAVRVSRLKNKRFDGYSLGPV
jgi:hypothetical protein